MNIGHGPNGVTVKLTKAEAKKLCEARYILNSLSGALSGHASGDGIAKSSDILRHAVVTFAGEHVSEEGHVIETPRQAAVTESAPG